ncbi:hypothetical protein L1765_13525, partial [Microaerobacter geothermalis]|uniref:hypothetical protein n=1 Tax=Microaerobacter geothermalis TaxID=674972 RepID=UPI001F3AB35B
IRSSEEYCIITTGNIYNDYPGHPYTHFYLEIDTKHLTFLDQYDPGGNYFHIKEVCRIRDTSFKLKKITQGG